MAVVAFKPRPEPAEPKVAIGCTSGTYDSHRLCARTGMGYGADSHRIQTDGPSEARIVAGGLARAAMPLVVVACLALFAAAFAHHGVADGATYPTSTTVALER